MASGDNIDHKFNNICKINQTPSNKANKLRPENGGRQEKMTWNLKTHHDFKCTLHGS